MTQPCGHPDSAIAGKTTQYCTACADVASTAMRAERAYCRGIVREELHHQHRMAFRDPSKAAQVDATIAVLERLLKELE